MKLLRLSKKLFYFLVIFLGVMKSLAFAVAVYAEQNSTVVESWISQAVGIPVHFKHIETNWAGIAPRLWLKEFAIGDQEVLQLGDMLLGLNLPGLINWRSNLPVNVKLTGLLTVASAGEAVKSAVGTGGGFPIVTSCVTESQWPPLVVTVTVTSWKPSVE